MNAADFGEDDLTALASAIDAAASKAAGRGLHISVDLMTRRVLDAARWGERDPQRLQEAALGDALHTALATPPALHSLELGQSFGLMPKRPMWVAA